MGFQLIHKLLFASFAIYQAVDALDVKDFAEFCPGNFITKDYNASWDEYHHRANPVSYIPIADKYTTYILTQFFYQTEHFSVLTEKQMENSCIIGNLHDGFREATWTGYGKSQKSLAQATNIPELWRFELPVGRGVVSGYSSIALTDNKNYIVWDSCFDNGLRGFSVTSSTRTLDDTSIAVIKAHLKSIGFKERNFVYLNYQNCLDENGSLVPYSSGDLPVPAPSRIPHLNLIGTNYLYPSYFFKKA